MSFRRVVNQGRNLYKRRDKPLEAMSTFDNAALSSADPAILWNASAGQSRTEASSHEEYVPHRTQQQNQVSGDPHRQHFLQRSNKPTESSRASRAHFETNKGHSQTASTQNRRQKREMRSPFQSESSSASIDPDNPSDINATIYNSTSHRSEADNVISRYYTKQIATGQPRQRQTSHQSSHVGSPGRLDPDAALHAKSHKSAAGPSTEPVQHLQSPTVGQAQQPKTKEDTFYDRILGKLSKAATLPLAHQMQILVDALQTSDTIKRRREKVLHDLQQFINQQYGTQNSYQSGASGERFVVQPFGSVILGVDNDSSDLDICILDRFFPGGCPDAMTKLPPIYNVNNLAQRLWKYEPFGRVPQLQPIKGAKVPIVKIKLANELSLDININEALGHKNTGLLRAYFDVVPGDLLSSLARVLKFHFKNRNLNDPS